MSLNTITDQELANRTSDMLAQLTKAHETFTAHDVTLRLRQAYPADFIPHVADNIHAWMAPFLAISDYDVEQRDYPARDGSGGTLSALTYYWVDTSSQPVVSNTQPIAAPGQTPAPTLQIAGTHPLDGAPLNLPSLN